MKYVYLFFLTIISLKAFPQLSYSEIDNLNTLCKKEDFEAVKILLKNNGYIIYKDDENYDHGSYFVVAEIQAKKKLGEYNLAWLKGTEIEDVNNIYDKIDIEFYERDDYKTIRISQSLTADKLNYIPNSRKWSPLFLDWVYQDWDYVREENVFKDSVWEKDSNGKISSELYRNYFSSKQFKEKENFTIVFRKDIKESGERIIIKHLYGTRNFPELKSKSYDIALILETIIEKGKNIKNDNKDILTFPLIKSGSSYLIKIKFGRIIKTYVLDSGASDMTLDDETYQYLRASNQLTRENNLTSREYVLADGSKVEYKRVRIPTFSINNIIVKNTTAVLVENDKPLLLGKSFLDNFKSWKVDNKNNILIIETF